MVFETIYNLVLEFFHPLGFLQPVPLCKGEGRGAVTGLQGGKGAGGRGARGGTPTCDHGQGRDAGEGRDVDVHVLQVGGKLNNGIDPLPEAADALQPVQDYPVAEDKLALHGV